MKTWIKIILFIIGFVLSFLCDYGIVLLLYSMNKGNIALSFAGLPEIAYIFISIYLFCKDEETDENAPS